MQKTNPKRTQTNPIFSLPAASAGRADPRANLTAGAARERHSVLMGTCSVANRLTQLAVSCRNLSKNAVLWLGQGFWLAFGGVIVLESRFLAGWGHLRFL